MRRLYIHIGLGKTGSSALQSWLSINAAELGRQGILYADLSEDARAGRASSGNGGLLVNALREKNFTEVERLLQDVYFPAPGHDSAIISSELLKDIRPPKLRNLHAVCRRLDIQPHIVVYVRSVYERAYSAYGQRVKTLGHTEPFGDGDIARSMLTTMAWLRKYRDEFGAAMSVLNYDAPGTDIYEQFAQVTGTDTARMQRLDKKVNRSLSHAEQEVQRQLNALHGGDFSSAITQHLVNKDPDRQSVVHYDPRLVQRTREVCTDSVAWVNERFTISPPLVCDLYETRNGSAQAETTTEILRSVAEWAVSYEPAAELKERYREFLPQLVELCAELPAETRTALLDRARSLD